MQSLCSVSVLFFTSLSILSVSLFSRATHVKDVVLENSSSFQSRLHWNMSSALSVWRQTTSAATKSKLRSSLALSCQVVFSPPVVLSPLCPSSARWLDVIFHFAFYLSLFLSPSLPVTSPITLSCFLHLCFPAHFPPRFPRDPRLSHPPTL